MIFWRGNLDDSSGTNHVKSRETGDLNVVSQAIADDDVDYDC